MTGYTLTWQTDAIDDLIRLGMMVDARSIQAVQNNVPLLLNDPRPINATKVPELEDTWRLPVASLLVEYEIIADSVISVLAVQPRSPNTGEEEP